MHENEIASGVVEAAFRVHRHFGPGLLESVYETCLEFELKDMGFDVRRQVHLPVQYRGMQLDAGYKLDLWVNGRVMIEVKAAQEIHPVFKMQLKTYLKLTDNRLGLLINFNTPLLKDGIRRVVNGLIEE
ncbi:MAG: GxxExxY protein [Flavobacteriales bacterium]|nr:GxxExxY protein [Flavobacteriales bacterium]MBK6884613.1 GxxExxY protein [Flavobacteriales bacterium]MBK7103645.1 GxxExxY protein [Flavobacteriales bacterium]MBK7111697.1 GxxExxY protein [Flavobacteriales bacterium]MBK7483941.1 GxxExxY protein [Flavobacteriales bacterium]